MHKKSQKFDARSLEKFEKIGWIAGDSSLI